MNFPGPAASLAFQFSSVQLLSRVWLFATPWTAACQASQSFTNSQSLLNLTSIELVMPSNHLILCRPLLLPPSIFPSIRVFQIQGQTQLPRSELLSSLGAQSSEFKPISQGEATCPWIAENLLTLYSVSFYFCLLPNGRFQIYHKSNSIDRISMAGMSLNKLWNFVSRWNSQLLDTSTVPN